MLYDGTMDPILFLKRSALFFFLVGAVLWLNGFRAYDYLSEDVRKPVQIVYAAENPGEGYLDGYAWSELVGWISFKGTCGTGCEYGVLVDGDGNLSGHGWSEHLGWLSFDKSDSGSAGALEPRVASKPSNAFIDYAQTPAELVGFGRFLSACVGNNCSGGTLKPEGGGWDGWVSLSRPSGSPDYKVELQANNLLSGYAWGDLNVGWVNFDDPGSFHQTAFVPELGAIVPPTAAPATGSGTSVAKIVFYTDRPELSTIGSFVITPNGAAAQTFPVIDYKLKQGGSEITSVAFAAYDSTGNNLIPKNGTVSFGAGANQQIRFRIAGTCGTCANTVPTGTYTAEVTMQYTDTVPPTPKTFVVNIPLQVTNLATSATQER